MVFSPTARLLLGLVVAFLGYFLTGELAIGESERVVLSTVVALLASAGIVPPRPEVLRDISAQLRFALTVLVTAAAAALQIIALDPTLRGLITAALLVTASIGIVPVQARRA